MKKSNTPKNSCDKKKVHSKKTNKQKEATDVFNTPNIIIPLNEDDILKKNLKDIKKDNVSNKKRKHIIRTTNKISNTFIRKKCKIDRQKSIDSEEKSSETSDINEVSSESIKSLTLIQQKRANKRNNNLEIRNIKTNKKITLECIRQFFNHNDYNNLKKYKFPYMSQSTFNFEIKKIDLRQLRALNFACPICSKPFRHFSMSYHIFQNHFEHMKEYLSMKSIAHSCAQLMEKEY